MSSNPFSLNGRIALVTGGLGQLGRAFTLALRNAGARVVVADLPADAALPPDENLFYTSVDVTRRGTLEKALASIVSHWGEAPHILLNNAALDSPPGAPAAENGPFEDYPESSWDKVMDVNTKGVFQCCQVFGGAMAAAGRGSVINISSIYGMVSPDQRIYDFRRVDGAEFFKPVAYSASKSALFNLTRYLATYWAPQNVRVNTLTFAGVFNNQPEAFLKNYLPKVPLGRMADPDDYTGPVVFLASDASRYMTGSNLVVDGGFTAW